VSSRRDLPQATKPRFLAQPVNKLALAVIAPLERAAYTCTHQFTQVENQMASINGSVIQIRDVNRVESARSALRIHVHEDGERPITLQLSPTNLKKLARMLEPLIEDEGYAAQRGKRLVKLARLKETYGVCLVAELLARYPEYDLDELERDLSKFSYT
jgi:ABC-type transporter Mla MlaB component